MATYKPMLKLKMKRIEKGLNQKELGQLVGVAQNTISCYEVGTKFPRRKVLDKLAEILGCEVGELI